MPFPTSDKIHDVCAQAGVTDRRIKAWLLREATIMTGKQIARSLGLDPVALSDDWRSVDVDRAYKERFRELTDALLRQAKDRPYTDRVATAAQIAATMKYIPRHLRR